MQLDTLHFLLMVAAAVMFWAGYRLREWDRGELKTLAAAAVSEALDDREKTSMPVSSSDPNEELKNLKARVGKLETNDGIRMKGISTLRDDISNLQGRVATLEEKADPLGAITERLKPLFDQLKS